MHFDRIICSRTCKQNKSYLKEKSYENLVLYRVRSLQDLYLAAQTPVTFVFKSLAAQQDGRYVKTTLFHLPG